MHKQSSERSANGYKNPPRELSTIDANHVFFNGSSAAISQITYLGANWEITKGRLMF
jgi:hypothetical protein